MCKNLKEKITKLKGKLSKLDAHSILIGTAAGVVLTTAIVVGYKMFPATKGTAVASSCSDDSAVIKALQLFGLENPKIIKKTTKDGICYYIVEGEKDKWKYEIQVPVFNKYLVMQGIDLTTLPQNTSNPLAMFSIKRVSIEVLKRIPPKFEPNVTQTPPKVDLFIMSNCPFGVPVANEFASLIESGEVPFQITPRYILSTSPSYPGQKGYKIGNTTFYSLHGPAEVVQDAVEKCIFYLYGQTGWAKFVKETAKLFNENKLAENPEERLKQLENITKQLGFDWNKVENCLKTKAEQLLKEDIELEKKYNAFASPTIYINGVQYFGNRTAKAFAEAICKSYANCNETKIQNLNISENASTSTPAPGSCNPK